MSDPVIIRLSALLLITTWVLVSVDAIINPPLLSSVRVIFAPAVIVISSSSLAPVDASNLSLILLPLVEVTKS